MFKDFVKIILYVTVNAPVPTHKDLWRPANPHGARAAQALSQTNASGLNLPSTLGHSGKMPHYEKQTLVEGIDVGGTRKYGPGWVDLNRPQLPEAVAHTAGSPERQAPGGRR